MIFKLPIFLKTWGFPVLNQKRILICNVNADDLSLKYRIEGDVTRIGQFDYVILKSFTWRFRGEGMKHLYLRNDDVVQGRPALSK